MSVIPTDEDHPDFTRPSQFTAAPVLHVNTNLSADYTSPAFYTGGYESLLVVEPTSSSVRAGFVQVRWFSEESLTNQISLTTWSQDQGYQIRDQVPNRGPWAQVKRHYNSYVGSPPWEILVVPRTGTPPGSALFGSGQLAGIVTPSIAAGASSTVDFLYVTGGMATLVVNCGTVNWDANVTVFDNASNNLGPAAALDGGGTKFADTTLFALPRLRAALNIHNRDGVAHGFNVSIWLAG